MDFTGLREVLRTTLASAAGAAALAAAAGGPAPAHAQDSVVAEPSPLPPGHVPVIVDPPSSPPPVVTESGLPPLPPVSQYADRQAWLSWKVRRTRNILIGSSAATAVGAALVFPAEFTALCGDTDPEGESTLNRCSPGGKAMVIFGYPLLLFGGLTMIASGITLGVTKGQLRRSESRAARQKTRALRWDPARAGFVF